MYFMYTCATLWRLCVCHTLNKEVTYLLTYFLCIIYHDRVASEGPVASLPILYAVNTMNRTPTYTIKSDTTLSLFDSIAV